MGTFSPSPFYTEEVDDILQEIHLPADGRRDGSRRQDDLQGHHFLWSDADPKMVRRCWNTTRRFGDPETQVVLPRMKNDIVEVFEACIDGTLDQIELEFEDNAAVCVVLASGRLSGEI